MNLKLFFLFQLITISFNGYTQNFTSENYQKNDFKLFYKNTVSNIIIDTNDFNVVKTSTSHLIDDINRVTGAKPTIHTSTENVNHEVIIIGTIGKSKWIDNLVKQGKIDVTNIKGKWETHLIQVIKNPYKKNSKALVIAGSDRRGTAYGIFEISKQMGVSPWYWWADVPVKMRQAVIVKNGTYSNGTPDVKYRGIFINDEDWGMQPWSKKTFEPELKNIGPKTYAKIFELLLRLKANYLWPAMHPCTGGFNEYPENKVVADNYAIIMGSSHHEPLLFNTEGEWDEEVKGEWNYVTNKENIYNQLNKRVEENGKYENIYTVGMRGLGDYGIAGDFTVEERIKITEDTINDQREILEKNLGEKASEVPQIFVPYAEVLHLYNNGLKVPDDVTLIWVDDNFGYIRRLSDPIEAKRFGGSGVYYHIAYLGNPHEYTWLSSTNTALIYEEMNKAYEYGANRVWIVNVGDIKPAEYNITFFLDLAWDVNMVNHTNVYSHQDTWYQSIFGKTLGKESADIMKTYYQLNFERKPEFMGWGEQYASVKWRERIEDTHYSFSTYSEAENRIANFNTLANKVKALYSKIPKEEKSVFYQLVYYPVVGATYNNYKLLLAQKNRMYAKLGHASTNYLAKQVKAYQDSIKMITTTYEDLENGKWKEIMSEIQSPAATFAYLPPIKTIDLPEKGDMGILVEEQKPVNGINQPLALPIYTSFYDETYKIILYNKGKKILNWNAKMSHDYIQLSETSGAIDTEKIIQVTIDWSKVSDQEYNQGTITFLGNNKTFKVAVKTFKPLQFTKDNFKNRYIEKNGYLSINLENFHRKVETEEAQFIKYNGLGQTGTAVGLASNKAKTIYVGAPIDSESWRNNVRRNSSIHKSSHYIAKPGKHTIKVFYADPGVIYDKLIVDLGGLKDSYLGPRKETIIIK